MALDIVEVADLPVKAGLLDYKMVQMRAQHMGFSENLFLLCSVLQQIFSLQLGCLKSTRTFPNTLNKESKRLLQIQRQKFISMTNWSLILQQEIAWDRCIKAFRVNIQGCKINKL